MPEEKQLRAPFNYSGVEGRDYHQRRELPEPLDAWIANVRAEKLQPFINETDSVFEYGVGFGWNLGRLSCAERAGYDVSQALIASLQSLGIKFVSNVTTLHNDSFDVVLCHHTLEHLMNPVEALAVMRRILKPDGRLLIFVPYEMERKYRTIHGADRAHHIYSWTPRSLANLITGSGFAVESAALRRFRFDRAAALLAAKFRVGQIGYRWIRGIAMLLLPEYEIQLIARKD